MNKKLKKVTLHVSNFKYDAESGVFTCYGNTKHNIDHAKDRLMDGVYKRSIKEHAEENTMPKMLWMHNPFELPVGKWLEWKEDEHGLFMKGKLSKTTMGSDLEILAKDGAIDSFSIGYYEIEAKWNSKDNCNDVYDILIKEVSWVNFACNEASTLESIKRLGLEDEGYDVGMTDGMKAAIKYFGFDGDEVDEIMKTINDKEKSKAHKCDDDHETLDSEDEEAIMSLFKAR